MRIRKIISFLVLGLFCLGGFFIQNAGAFNYHGEYEFLNRNTSQITPTGNLQNIVDFVYPGGVAFMGEIFKVSSDHHRVDCNCSIHVKLADTDGCCHKEVKLGITDPNFGWHNFITDNRNTWKGVGPTCPGIDPITTLITAIDNGDVFKDIGSEPDYLIDPSYPFGDAESRSSPLDT